MSDTLNLSIDGEKLSAPRNAYAKAKLKQLSEFGYNDLDLKTVQSEIDMILAGKTLKDGLTIIGGFMVDEIIKPEAKKSK